MGKKIKAIVCIMAAVIGIWRGLGQLGLFKEFSGIRYYELEEKVPMDTAAAMRAEEAGKMTDLVLWDFLDGQTVSIHAPVERTGKVSVVTVCGTPKYLTGNFTVPYCGDTQGCLLDSGTAWKLFGTEEATGESVIYQGKEYKIKGILDKMEPTMLIQASADYNGGFGRMTLAGGSGTGDWELENRIRNRYGVSLEKIEWGIARAAVKLAFCVMPLSVYVLVWKRLYKHRKSRKPTDKAAAVLGVAAGTVLFSGLLWITGIRGIPAEYIPPQWSDFEFYKKVWGNLGNAWKNLFRSSFSTFELRMVQNNVILFLDIILTGIAMCCLGIGLCDRLLWQMDEKKDLMMGGKLIMEKKDDMGRMEPKTPFNLATVCLDVYEDLFHAFRKEGYMLRVDPGNAFDVSVVIDRRQVHRALCLLFYGIACHCEKGTEFLISSRDKMVTLEGMTRSDSDMFRPLEQEKLPEAFTRKDNMEKAVKYIWETGGQVKVLNDREKIGIGVAVENTKPIIMLSK